jgi:LysM repeat protein
MSEERNQRPKEGSSLPVITLVVLVGLIAALLYVGYEYATDETSTTTEITPNQRLATTEDTPEELTEEEPPAEEVTPPTGTTVAPVPLETAPDAKPTATAPAEGEARSEAEVKDEPKKELPKPEPAKPEPAKPEPARPEPAKTETAAVPAGGASTTHTVQPGQTFYSIATRYNLSAETLKKLNPGVDPSNVKAGSTKLNVKVRAVHTVGAGDILRVVAQKYGVTVDQLMKANGKTKNYAQRGERLVIPYPNKQ